MHISWTHYSNYCIYKSTKPNCSNKMTSLVYRKQRLLEEHWHSLSWNCYMAIKTTDCPGGWARRRNRRRKQLFPQDLHEGKQLKGCCNQTMMLKNNCSSWATNCPSSKITDDIHDQDPYGGQTSKENKDGEKPAIQKYSMVPLSDWALHILCTSSFGWMVIYWIYTWMSPLPNQTSESPRLIQASDYFLWAP